MTLKTKAADSIEEISTPTTLTSRSSEEGTSTSSILINEHPDNTLLGLPEELKVEILGYLTRQELIIMGSTCKEFHRIIYPEQLRKKRKQEKIQTIKKRMLVRFPESYKDLCAQKDKLVNWQQEFAKEQFKEKFLALYNDLDTQKEHPVNWQQELAKQAVKKYSTYLYEKIEEQQLSCQLINWKKTYKQAVKNYTFFPPNHRNLFISIGYDDTNELQNLITGFCLEKPENLFNIVDQRGNKLVAFIAAQPTVRKYTLNFMLKHKNKISSEREVFYSIYFYRDKNAIEAAIRRHLKKNPITTLMPSSNLICERNSLELIQFLLASKLLSNEVVTVKDLADTKNNKLLNDMILMAKEHKHDDLVKILVDAKLTGIFAACKKNMDGIINTKYVKKKLTALTLLEKAVNNKITDAELATLTSDTFIKIFHENTILQKLCGLVESNLKTIDIELAFLPILKQPIAKTYSKIRSFDI